MESGLSVTAVLGATQLNAGAAHAEQGPPIESKGAPWPLRDSQAFEFRSRAIGDTIAVGIWSSVRPGPSNEAKPVPLELVYVLDGSFALAVAAASCRLLSADLVNPGFPPVLLVGLDYPEGRPNARTRDYTMTDSVPDYMGKLLGAGTPETTPGGADRFLEFLESELDPFLRSRYEIKEGPAGILGDSFGGTFTFYAFLRQSKLFDRYWLGSPGIFETRADYVAQFETCLSSSLAHPTKMFLSIGTREMAGGVGFYEEIGRSFNRTVSALWRKSPTNLTWSAKTYEGHTHTSVLMPALNDALIYLYGKSPA